MKDEGYLVRFSLCRLTSVSSLSLVIKDCSSLPGMREGTPSQGEFMFCFLVDAGRAESFSCVCFF